jgi:hypothetical protein
MRTRVVAAILALGVVAFVGVFVWTVVWTLDPRATSAKGDAPTAEISEQLSDGRLDVQVFALGGRDVRLEIQFMPDADAIELAVQRPDVNFAMVEMHMDGIDSPLELVEAGVWRANLKLPMAGRWVVNVGFGDDFAEIEFDAK